VHARVGLVGVETLPNVVQPIASRCTYSDVSALQVQLYSTIVSVFLAAKLHVAVSWVVFMAW
jgi:hypothetical protein